MCLVYAWLNSQLKSKIGLLDRGSIRSSPDRLRISAGLFLHVLVYMGEKVDLHLVHPALNLSILDAGILRMAQQVRLIMFFLTMVFSVNGFISYKTCYNYYYCYYCYDYGKKILCVYVSVCQKVFAHSCSDSHLQ